MIASSEVFLDTNILLYAALGRDHAGHRWERAREIVLTEDYCTSGQVLAEFYNNATRKGAPPLSSDGAIIAAAERLGAKVLYSEVLTHGQTYGSVRVENPFLSA